MFGIKAMGTNAFHRLRTPSTVCGRSPSLEEGGIGFRRSRPSALPSIAYRGFAVAPMTLRAPSRRFSYNPGCRVETLLVSKGVMGFLGDLRGRNSKSPPNPLGLAERGYSFHRCGRSHSLEEGGMGMGKSRVCGISTGARCAPTMLRRITQAS